MAKVVFKDKNRTERIVSNEQLQFILGIRGIKSKIFTYQYI
ncbi:hypothetical protein OD350_29250 (plasmid) [Clostridium beijerinckii]|nr:hypothetical protein [Clostridium beijerinckii]UYZ38976.1 hypothetical protein OD350_29250 [Clostridium beijerinckii]